ncbi:MAG: iron ABC transporter permease [Deltaproteobacteria bacterium]|nr:iron ABC transporter permease [Deltaproteobacteria bacterium]
MTMHARALGLLFLLCAGVTISLGLGRYPVGPHDLALALGLGTESDPDRLRLLRTLIVEVRLPRILAAICVGAALSVSGAAFQAMFINPLVSPGLLGVLAGASLGAALGMVLSTHWIVIQIATFACGLLAVGLAMLMARLYRGDRVLLLVLSGVVVSALFTALLSIIKYLADPYNQLPAITYWLMGGFSLVSRESMTLMAPIMGLGVGLILSLSGSLNALTMGDEEARTLGLRVARLRMVLILAATLISSLTVVVGGIIGWVGLIIPHVGRMLVGPDNRILLPVSALLGALYLLVVDNLSRLIFPVEIPLGILTSLLGIPVFALALRRSRGGWS